MIGFELSLDHRFWRIERPLVFSSETSPTFSGVAEVSELLAPATNQKLHNFVVMSTKCMLYACSKCFLFIFIYLPQVFLWLFCFWFMQRSSQNGLDCLSSFDFTSACNVVHKPQISRTKKTSRPLRAAKAANLTTFGKTHTHNCIQLVKTTNRIEHLPTVIM